jgi:hypothetical protein
MKGRFAGKRKRNKASSPAGISAPTMKMIEQSAANLKKGRASAPINIPRGKQKSR